MMTERLYHADSHLKQFEASVVGRDAAGRRVYLDRTAFYPTSGGQPFDTGELELAQGAGTPPLRVVDVIDEGERIAHVLETGADERCAPGATVRGRIDWARRLDHMQQHSGQHLLSAVFHELFGLATLSVHFGAESSTLDLEVASLSREQVQAVEARANALVCENLAVSARIEAAGAAPELRKASERTGPLRVVSIEGLDQSACGGTHVSRTGEIGPILLRKLERVRKQVRVEFVCGGRAVRRARTDYELLSQIALGLGSAVDDVAGAVAARTRELGEKSTALRTALESLDDYRARELHAGAAELSAADRHLKLARLDLTSGTLQDLRGLAQRYAALPGGVLIASVREPPSLLLAAAEDSGVDAGALLKGVLARSGGRGGGSARVAQGTTRDAAALSGALQELETRLRTASAGAAERAG